MLVNWGIKSAEAKCWPVTLCASPMGRFFYVSLGFQTVATEVVRVEGEGKTIESTVMVLPPKRACDGNYLGDPFSPLKYGKRSRVSGRESAVVLRENGRYIFIHGLSPLVLLHLPASCRRLIVCAPLTDK
ncbi:hypothetical protein V8F33_011834 [Rhypophila sp. PSN 637]